MMHKNNISINGIAHIALSVRSLNVSKKFYKLANAFPWTKYCA